MADCRVGAAPRVAGRSSTCPRNGRGDRRLVRSPAARVPGCERQLRAVPVGRTQDELLEPALLRRAHRSRPRPVPLEPADRCWRSSGSCRRCVRERSSRRCSALGFLLQVWINGSVASWSLAGAFGARRFVSTTRDLRVGSRDAAGSRAAAPRKVVVRGHADRLSCGGTSSLMVQFGLRLMDRQRLEWPRVAVNQVTRGPATARDARPGSSSPTASGWSGRADDLEHACSTGSPAPSASKRRAVRRARAPRASHETCLAEYAATGRLRLWRTRQGVAWCCEDERPRCPCCGVGLPACAPRQGYVDLRPADARWATVTQYADHEFHERLGVDRHAARAVGAGQGRHDAEHARARGPARGCSTSAAGAGKLGAATRSARGAAVDRRRRGARSSCRAPSREVAIWCSGDLRRLPLRKGAFSRRLLARRARAPRRGRGARGARRGASRARRLTGGSSSTPTRWSPRAWRAFSVASTGWPGRLGRAGLIDHEREALRKSDHLNADPQPRALRGAVRRGGPAGRRAALLQRRVQGGRRGPAAAALRAAGAGARGAPRSGGEPAGLERRRPRRRRPSRAG